jgi:hypothetical protein
MGASHFTGPLISGPILNTSGTTLGQDVADVGYVMMAQAQAVTQAGSTTALATGVVVPAYSLIVGIDVLATTGWASSATVSVGTSATATELVSAATGPQAIGLSNLSPGTDATRTGKWINVGSSDVRIFVLSSGGTGGAGTLVVRYVQAINAP